MEPPGLLHACPQLLWGQPPHQAYSRHGPRQSGSSRDPCCPSPSGTLQQDSQRKPAGCGDQEGLRGGGLAADQPSGRDDSHSSD